MESFIIIIHVLAAVSIVGLVLLQQGKGADMGASFGSGASQTVFGSVGSGNFLTKSTTLMATIFFVTSIGLAIIARQKSELGVQDNSLISGDISQITSQANPASKQTTEASDLPVVEEEPVSGNGAPAEQTGGPDGDVPAVENTPDDTPAPEPTQN